MGGLHLEQAALVCIGQLLTGTGIEDIISAASLDTIGLVTAVCDVNNIKKARYTLQVIVVVLMKNMERAYTADESENETDIAFEDWVNSQTDPLFIYWNQIIKYIKITLMLVRSFRESNFKLLIGSLESFIPLFFALDHMHYARWCSVFVNDLKTLSEKFPQVHQQFTLGNFTVNTKGVKFSNIALDQAQEHNNKRIKSIGGYINLVNDGDKEFLRKLEVCIPEINQYLLEPEPRSETKHKEVSENFVKKFISDCNKVDEKVLTNPFRQQRFIKLNSSYIYPEVIQNDSEKVFQLGMDQYKDFQKTRFIEGTLDVIESKISKNMLKLPKDSNVVQIQTPCLKITDSMFIKLRDACIHRTNVARDLFVNEISGAPECFLDKKAQEPYHNSKSAILDCIVKEYVSNLLNADGLIIDLSFVIRSQISVVNKGVTFNELSRQIFQSIENQAET